MRTSRRARGSSPRVDTAGGRSFAGCAGRCPRIRIASSAPGSVARPSPGTSGADARTRPAVGAALSDHENSKSRLQDPQAFPENEPRSGSVDGQKVGEVGKEGGINFKAHQAAFPSNHSRSGRADAQGYPCSEDHEDLTPPPGSPGCSPSQRRPRRGERKRARRTANAAGRNL